MLSKRVNEDLLRAHVTNVPDVNVEMRIGDLGSRSAGTRNDLNLRGGREDGKHACLRPQFFEPTLPALLTPLWRAGQDIVVLYLWCLRWLTERFAEHLLII